MKKNLSIIKCFIPFVIAYVLMAIGYFVLHDTWSWMIDYLYKPYFVYNPAILLSVFAIILIICAFTKKEKLVKGVTIVAFVILCAYYLFVTVGATALSKNSTNVTNKINQISDINNFFPIKEDNVREVTQGRNNKYSLINTKAYETAMVYSDYENEEDNGYILQEVSYFSNVFAPYLKSNIIDELYYEYFVRERPLNGFTDENTISGEKDGVKYKYAFAEDNEYSENSQYEHTYYYSILIYDNNTTYQFFCNYKKADDGIELNAEEKTLEILQSLKENELI